MRSWRFLAALAATMVFRSPAAAAQEPAAPRSRLGVEYGYVAFDDEALDPWHLVTTELSHRTGAGTLVGRANWAERFGGSGLQLEADAYPRLGRGSYLYLNLGFSEAEIFPEVRAGAEAFTILPDAFEVSLGARRLWFRETDVTLLTGSIAKYAGNYYVSLRPFLTPRDEDTGYSATLLARRYFGDVESHVTLAVGAGSTPGDAPLQFELDRETSARASLYGRHPVARRLGVRWSAGWEREELATGNQRTRLSVGAGAEIRF